MTALRKTLILVLALGILASTAACGRKSAPKPPPDSTYPREYPTE
ncbi:MAG: lipoprotein [Rhodospirillales bacterium]|nr:lipoprotein [Rhodospirillales bacterium]